jgi:hypothetical protein
MPDFGSTRSAVSMYGSQTYSWLLSTCNLQKSFLCIELGYFLTSSTVYRVRHYMLLRQTGSAIGQKIEPDSPSQMQWRCTLRTHGCLFSLSQLFVPSSYCRAPLVHKIGTHKYEVSILSFFVTKQLLEKIQR